MSGNDATTVLKTLYSRYIDLFNLTDFKTAADEMYALPFSWVVGNGIATANTVDEFVAKMEGMRAGLDQLDFERSELTGCTVRLLGENIALVGVEVARHFRGGKPIEMTGGTYTAHNDGTSWRFINVLSHPLDAIVPAA